MANPYQYINPSGPAAFPYGPGQTPDNLTGLPNGQALFLGAVGTTQLQYYDDNIAPFEFTLTTPSNGVITLLIIVSEDGVVWTGGINPGSTPGDQSGQVQAYLNSGPPAPFQLIRVNTSTSATFYTTAAFSIAQVLNYMPTFWAIGIWNQSGSAFSNLSGQFYAKHNLIGYS